MSLLRRAIICETISCIKVILDTYLSLILTSEGDYSPLASFYGENVPEFLKLSPHVTDLISVEDICLVSDKFPELFLDFVKNLRVVPNYSLTVSSKWSFLTSDLLLRGAAVRVETCFWGNDELDDGNATSRRYFQIEPYIIPIKNIAGFKSPFLSAVVKTVDRVGSYDVFDNEVVQYVIKFKWQMFVSSMFFKDFLLLVALSVMFYVNSIIFVPCFQSTNYMKRSACHGVLVTTILLSSYFIFREVRLLIKTKEFVRKMTILHLVVISLVVATLVVQSQIAFFDYNDNNDSRSRNTVVILSAVTLPALAAEIIFSLGGFQRYGPLVRMIVKMLTGIKEFSLILLIILISFSGSIMVLFQDVDVSLLTYDGYSTLLRCFMTVYGLFFAQMSLSDLDQSKSPPLAHTLVAVFLFIVIIVLLNLLIALMGDKYAEVQQNASCEAQYALARITLEYETLLPHIVKKQCKDSWFPTWIQILRRDDTTSDGNSRRDTRASWHRSQLGSCSLQKVCSRDEQVESTSTVAMLRQIQEDISTLKSEMKRIRGMNGGDNDSIK